MIYLNSHLKLITKSDLGHLNFIVSLSTTYHELLSSPEIFIRCFLSLGPCFSSWPYCFSLNQSSTSLFFLSFTFSTGWPQGLERPWKNYPFSRTWKVLEKTD